jgi:hypothetical protein
MIAATKSPLPDDQLSENRSTERFGACVVVMNLRDGYAELVGYVTSRRTCWSRSTSRCLALAGLETRSVGKQLVDMDVAAAMVVAIFVVLTAALVIGLFIWAAVKDGREDKALQARLGIRRRTRLGR